MDVYALGMMLYEIFNFSKRSCLFLFSICYSVFKEQVFNTIFIVLVGLGGLEPPTSRLSGARSNHLSYAPLWLLLFAVPLLIPLVEMMGIEPMTPCLQGRCSPS